MSRKSEDRRDSTTPTTGRWEATFPESIEIPADSTLFAFRFIKLTTSFILDKRDLLGDSFFKSRAIEKMLIPQFDKSNPASVRIDKKMNGLKPAIEKRYLREFAIVFYQRPDEEDILEVYSLRLMYGDNGEISVSVNSGLGTEESNQNLILATFTDTNTTKSVFMETVRKLYRCIKQLKSLPEDSDASFRISFTDEAPKDYMPDGFDMSPRLYELSSEHVRYQVGVVCGGHHKVQLLAASRLAKTPIIDLNQTRASINQSILVPTPTKAKGLRGTENTRPNVRSPYGQTLPITKRKGQARSSK